MPSFGGCVVCAESQCVFLCEGHKRWVGLDLESVNHWWSPSRPMSDPSPDDPTMTALCADVRFNSTRRTTRVTDSTDVSPARLTHWWCVTQWWVTTGCSVLFEWALSQRRPDEDLSSARLASAGRGHGSSHRLTDTTAHSTDRQSLVSG